MHFKLHIRRVQLIINPRGIIISFMCIQVASSLDVVLASSPVVGSYQRHPDLLECPGIRPCESALAFRCCRTRTGFVPPCVFWCILLRPRPQHHHHHHHHPWKSAEAIHLSVLFPYTTTRPYPLLVNISSARA